MLTGFDLEEHEEQMAMVESEEAEFAGQTLGTLRDRTMLLLLWWLWQMPLASAKNLSDIGFFPVGKIHRLLQEIVDYGYIGRLELGVGHRKTSRYFLHRKGISCLNQGLPLIFRYAWQMTEAALERFICRLRMMEAIYDVATWILQSNAVQTPAFLTRHRTAPNPGRCSMRVCGWSGSPGSAAVRSTPLPSTVTGTAKPVISPLFGTDCTMGRTLYPLL